MAGADSPDRDVLRRRLARLLGDESAAAELLIDRDPAFLSAYADMAEAVWNGPNLSSKDKHLICLAANASVTHLHRPGLARHLAGALAAGADEREILATLELVSALGVHSITTGFPILIEEAARIGRPIAAGPLEPRQEAARQAFAQARGAWNPRFEPVARLAPQYLTDYAAFSAHPARAGALDAKLREFLYIAIDGAVTHLFEPGLRVHIRAALDLGATPEEIAELLALLSLIGIEGCLAGLAEFARPAGPGASHAR